MHHYLHQLHEDLEEAANHPPVLPFIEIPPHMQHDPVAGEPPLVPFKPIIETMKERGIRNFDVVRFINHILVIEYFYQRRAA